MNRQFDWCWLKRCWFEFRQGHNIYLSFIPSFMNFILLSFNLFVLTYLGFGNSVSNLAYYAVLAVCLYVPTAVAVGRWHTKKQMRTDNTIQSDQNPYWQNIVAELKALRSEIKETRREIAELKAKQ